jgi:hypothetical protein
VHARGEVGLHGRVRIAATVVVAEDATVGFTTNPSLLNDSLP